MADPVAARIVAKMYGQDEDCRQTYSLELTPAELRLLRMAIGATHLGLRRAELDDWTSFRSKLDALPT